MYCFEPNLKGGISACLRQIHVCWKLLSQKNIFAAPQMIHVPILAGLTIFFAHYSVLILCSVFMATKYYILRLPSSGLNVSSHINLELSFWINWSCRLIFSIITCSIYTMFLISNSFLEREFRLFHLRNDSC